MHCAATHFWKWIVIFYVLHRILFIVNKCAFYMCAFCLRCPIYCTCSRAFFAFLHPPMPDCRHLHGSIGLFSLCLYFWGVVCSFFFLIVVRFLHFYLLSFWRFSINKVHSSCLLSCSHRTSKVPGSCPPGGLALGRLLFSCTQSCTASGAGQAVAHPKATQPSDHLGMFLVDVQAGDVYFKPKMRDKDYFLTLLFPILLKKNAAANYIFFTTWTKDWWCSTLFAGRGERNPAALLFLKKTSYFVSFCFG